MYCTSTVCTMCAHSVVAVHWLSYIVWQIATISSHSWIYTNVSLLFYYYYCRHNTRRLYSIWNSLFLSTVRTSVHLVSSKCTVWLGLIASSFLLHPTHFFLYLKTFVQFIPFIHKNWMLIISPYYFSIDISNAFPVKLINLLN